MRELKRKILKILETIRNCIIVTTNFIIAAVKCISLILKDIAVSIFKMILAVIRCLKATKNCLKRMPGLLVKYTYKTKDFIISIKNKMISEFKAELEPKLEPELESKLKRKSERKPICGDVGDDDDDDDEDDDDDDDDCTPPERSQPPLSNRLIDLCKLYKHTPSLKKHVITQTKTSVKKSKTRGGNKKRPRNKFFKGTPPDIIATTNKSQKKNTIQRYSWFVHPVISRNPMLFEQNKTHLTAKLRYLFL